MRPLLVLRPQPGADATAARAKALGLDAIVTPLFRIEPCAWDMPDGAFDALLRRRFSVANCRGVAYGLEPLRSGSNPPLSDKLRRTVQPHRFPATLGSSINHGLDRRWALAASADAQELVGEGNLSRLVSEVILLVDQADPFDVEAVFKRRNDAALLGCVTFRSH